MSNATGIRWVLGIDPGTSDSAFCLWDGEKERVADCDILPNEHMLERLRAGLMPIAPYFDLKHQTGILAIEKVVSYGMPVGAETFETVFWYGRFAEAWKRDFRQISRKEIKLHLCGSPRAKDPNVRQVLMDRFGKPGTKKNPGPLYGVKTHIWSALAVAASTYDIIHNNH